MSILKEDVINKDSTSNKSNTGDTINNTFLGYK